MSQPPYPPQQPWGQPGQPQDPPQDPYQPGQPRDPYQAQPQNPYQPGQPDPSQAAPWTPVPPVPAPEQPKRRGKLLAAAAAVIVVAGGGVASYVAFSDGGDNSASSPRDAVEKVFADLNNSDLLGVLDDLAPSEKRALADPVREDIEQLKRLNVLNKSADPNKVSAISFRAEGLTYADKTVPVNDHVQLVEVTGGKLTVSADASRLPLTRAFLDAAYPNGLPESKSKTTTKDLAEINKSLGHPLQIAVQKVDGKWYPSLFYTVAQAIADKAGMGAPNPSERIANVGTSSPDEAVRELINAFASQDWKRAIELSSPGELGVLHDYGPLLLKKAGPASKPSFTFKDIEFDSKDISGGKRMALKSVEIDVQGQTLGVSVSGGCFNMKVGDQEQKMCGTDLLDMFGSFGGSMPALTEAQKQAFTHVINGVTSVGVDVSQTGGKWYVDGVRTVADEAGTVLAALEGNDLIELIKLGSS